MSIKIRFLLAFILVIFALLGALGIARGFGAGGTPALRWWVLGSGGGPAGDGSIVVNSTIGQPLVGVPSNNAITIKSGYWPIKLTNGIIVRLPFIQR
jgi:hypothetical protein